MAEELWVKRKKLGELTPAFAVPSDDGYKVIGKLRSESWTDAVRIADYLADGEHEEDDDSRFALLVAVADKNLEGKISEMKRPNGERVVELEGRDLGAAVPTGLNLLACNNVHSQASDLGAYSDAKQLGKMRSELEDIVDEVCKKALPAGVDRAGEIKNLCQKMKVQLAGDGAPSIWFLQNPSDKSMPISGKFHLMQNCLGWIVVMYEKVFLDPALHTVGRKTDPQKQYLKGCSDIDLALQFMKELGIAIRVEGVQQYMRSARDEEYPAAATMDDWMWELAESCPALCVIMRFLADLDLVLVLDNCERASNSEDYKHILPFLAQFSSKSNAIKYLPLLVAEMIFLETCSFAELEIFKTKLFTFNTTGGTDIYLDRFVEWTIKALKEVLGKTFTSEKLHKKRVDVVTANLDQFLDSKSPATQRVWENCAPRKVGNKRKRERRFKAGKSFFALLEAIKSSGLMDAERGEVTCFGGEEVFKRGEMRGPSGVAIMAAFFDTTTGGERVAAYADRQIKGGKPGVGKFELARLKVTSSDATAQSIYTWNQKHSVDIAFILKGNNITKAVMMAELQSHSKIVFGNSKWPEEVFLPGWDRDQTDPAKPASKVALGKLLQVVRTRLHLMRGHKPPELPKKPAQLPRGTSAAKLLRTDRLFQNLCINE